MENALITHDQELRMRQHWWVAANLMFGAFILIDFTALVILQGVKHVPAFFAALTLFPAVVAVIGFRHQGIRNVLQKTGEGMLWCIGGVGITATALIISAIYTIGK